MRKTTTRPTCCLSSDAIETDIRHSMAQCSTKTPHALQTQSEKCCMKYESNDHASALALSQRRFVTSLPQLPCLRVATAASGEWASRRKPRPCNLRTLNNIKTKKKQKDFGEHRDKTSSFVIRCVHCVNIDCCEPPKSTPASNRFSAWPHVSRSGMSCDVSRCHAPVSAR